jgi:hypothetical protein
MFIGVNVPPSLVKQTMKVYRYSILLIIVLFTVVFHDVITADVKQVWKSSSSMLSLNNYAKLYTTNNQQTILLLTDYRLYLIDSTSGKVKSELPVPNCTPRSSVLLSDNGGTLYCGGQYSYTPNYNITRLNIVDGTWSQYTLADFASQGGIVDAMKVGNDIQLYAILSSIQSPGYTNIFTSLVVRENQFAGLLWNYTAVNGNLNGYAIDSSKSLVYIADSNYFSAFDAENGQVIYKADKLPDYLLIMNRNGYVSYDHTVVYFVGSNRIRGKGASLFALDTQSGSLITTIDLPGVYMRGTAISVDGKHLYLLTDGGRAVFCLKEKQVVWKQELANQNGYSVSAVGTSSTPYIAFSNSKENVTEFVAQGKPDIVFKYPEYLGDDLVSDPNTSTSTFYAYTLQNKVQVTVQKFEISQQ